MQEKLHNKETLGIELSEHIWRSYEAYIKTSSM